MELTIKSASELEAAIEAQVQQSIASKDARVQAAAVDTNLSPSERTAKITQIIDERVNTATVREQCKIVVIFNDEYYEYVPKVQPQRPLSAIVGTTAKPLRFAVGDKIQFVDDGARSPVYEIRTNGRLVADDGDGAEITASQAVLLFKCEQQNVSITDFKDQYYIKHGVEFKGYPGLSHPKWMKVSQ